MNKYISREFIMAMSLIITASVALFILPKVGFVEWSAACAGFSAIYTSGKTIQKVKNGKKK